MPYDPAEHGLVWWWGRSVDRVGNELSRILRANSCIGGGGDVSRGTRVPTKKNQPKCCSIWLTAKQEVDFSENTREKKT